MVAYERIIHKLCQNSFTRHEAKRLFSLASQRTGRNTGHDLGDGHGALPQICAFLASEATGSYEVTCEQARSSACLDAKTFASALQTVRRVLPSGSTSTPDLKKVAYSALVRQHQVSEDANVPMMEVADNLRKSGSLDDTQLEMESPAVQCAIFYWVCSNILELTIPDFPVYHEQYKFSRRAWNLALRLLDENCSHMIERLASCAKTAAQTRSRTRTRSQTLVQPRQLSIAPSTPKPTKNSPGGISPRKKSVLVVSIPARTRKTPIDAEESHTPSKRLKVYTSSPLSKDGEINSSTPTRNAAAIARGNASLSPKRHDIETGTIVVRSQRDSPRRTASGQSNQPSGTPLKKTSSSIFNVTPSKSGALDSTPMTSTGMSDVFSESPSSNTRPSHASRQPRFRNQFTDIPWGVRRRNLRAPFLDEGAYSWRPSAKTKEKLENARRLESMLIARYGDPWSVTCIN